MKKCPSKRIRYLKTLQHLARKHKADIRFGYTTYMGVRYWYGFFASMDSNISDVQVSDTNFTTMLQKLHYEVRKGGI
jgi:hypothetical protein